MSVITINGQQVDVGDDFDKLSPADQESTKAEIATQLGHHEEAATTQTKKEEEQNAPVAPYDVTNSQSAVRSYGIDPLLAAGSGALDLANNVMGSPVGHALEIGGGAYAAKKYGEGLLSQALNRPVSLTRGNGPQVSPNVSAGPAVPEAPAPKIAMPDTYQSVRQPAISPNTSGTANQTMEALRDTYSPRVQPATPNAIPNSSVNVVRSATPPVGGAPAAQADNFLSSIAQKYGQVANKVAPVAEKIMSNPIINNPVTRFLGSKAGAGLQLALHSPELNSGEDEQIRLMHQKQDLERQQLANKHATEMNKYVQTKQSIGQ
jgi:hypothetical protein